MYLISCIYHLNNKIVYICLICAFSHHATLNVSIVEMRIFFLVLIASLSFPQQEWINMTGFLCALGGVCLQQRSTPGPATYSPPMGPSVERKHSMISMGNFDVSNPLASTSSCSSSASSETPVSRFLDRLLSLLVCGHDRVGLHIRTNVKDLLGLELSPALYPMLFNKLRNSIGKFFETQGPVSSSH